MLFENEGFTDEIKEGFVIYLLGASLPVHELLAPSLTNQQTAFANHFQGMSHIPFSYDDFEQTRMNLIDTLTRSLSAQDKDFIHYPFQNLSYSETIVGWTINLSDLDVYFFSCMKFYHKKIRLQRLIV